MSEPTDIEKKSLEAHVELCAERYRAIDRHLDTVGKKIDDISDMAQQTLTAVTALSEEFNAKILKLAGVVIATLMGTIGFLLSHYLFK